MMICFVSIEDAVGSGFVCQLQGQGWFDASVRRRYQWCDRCFHVTAMCWHVALWPRCSRSYRLYRLDRTSSGPDFHRVVSLISPYLILHYLNWIHFYRTMRNSAKRILAIACRLSVCDVGGSWPHSLKILETNCANNYPNIFALRSPAVVHLLPGNMETFWGENVRSTPTSMTSGWIESTESHVILSGGVAVCLLLSAHRAVILAIAQLSCIWAELPCDLSQPRRTGSLHSARLICRDWWGLLRWGQMRLGEISDKNAP